MFKSIRGNLLGWQAVVLLAVVFGFGTALYLRVRYAMFEQVDADLLGAAQVVAAKLQQAEAAKLEIPEAYRYRFGADVVDAPYLIVWNRNGRVQITSAGAPSELRPVKDLPAQQNARPFYGRSRGPYREVIIRGPTGSHVLVGRQTGREQNELARLLWWLLGTGAGIVGLGLGGAWLLSRRILAPIEEISRLAERISAANLSERINRSRIKSELGRLAEVLNQMFERLQASFQQQVRFTADASHELRTPTAVVLAQTEMALAKDRSQEEYREALGACRRAAKRMESLVDGLLTLARIDAGQLEIRHDEVDMQQVVENSVALLKPLAEQKQIALRCDLHAARVSGDAARLCQVVTNLINNAIAYNHAGGQVHMRLTAEEHHAVVTVSDTGIGIDESDMPKIFGRFYRADKARTVSHGGAGLGLTICQGIVHGLGGTIEVASVLGEGTTFTVRLPLS
jgi:two-component system, OmpR family, sensor kinase